MTITYHNGLAIGEIIVYVPAFLTACFLTYKHGLNKSAGWYFLCIFTLVRIVGASMQLALISSPNSISLLTGATILAQIGISPLILATLGLLSRLINDINVNRKTHISARHIKIIETVLTVGFILGIVGGVQAGQQASQPPYVYTVQTISKAGTGIFIACFVLTCLAAIMIFPDISAASTGEQRILYGVAISLPFLAVRLIYSSLSTFTGRTRWSMLTGNPTILLCMALLEELVVVIVYESIGLTLNKLPKGGSNSADYLRTGGQPPAKQDNILLRIAKRSIIGKIVMAFIPEKKAPVAVRDLEMQSEPYMRK